MRGAEEAMLLNQLDYLAVTDCELNECGTVSTLEAMKPTRFHLPTLQRSENQMKDVGFALWGNSAVGWQHSPGSDSDPRL